LGDIGGCHVLMILRVFGLAMRRTSLICNAWSMGSGVMIMAWGYIFEVDVLAAPVASVSTVKTVSER
jgi:hypothetical protein